jgi:hypothetical protein
LKNFTSGSALFSIYNKLIGGAGKLGMTAAFFQTLQCGHLKANKKEEGQTRQCGRSKTNKKEEGQTHQCGRSKTNRKKKINLSLWMLEGV